MHWENIRIVYLLLIELITRISFYYRFLNKGKQGLLAIFYFSKIKFSKLKTIFKNCLAIFSTIHKKDLVLINIFHNLNTNQVVGLL